MRSEVLITYSNDPIAMARRQSKGECHEVRKRFTEIAKANLEGRRNFEARRTN